MQSVFSGFKERNTASPNISNRFGQGVAWIEGEFAPLHEARIPIMDQGLLRSDLAYDVPAVWDGRFFRLDDHLDRFEASCQKMRLSNPMDRKALRNTLEEMVAKSGLRDAYVELIVTRGLKGVREYKTSPCNLYLLVMPYVWIMPPELQLTGGQAIVARTVRRTPPGAMDPTIKNLQWGDFVRGVLEAMDRGAMYPLLSDGDGNLTEGAGYNVFAVKDRLLMTPVRGVLQGVTRKTVLELASSKGLKTLIDFIPIESLYNADEIFLTSTAGGIMPISELDGHKVGNGKVGPVTRALWEAYWEAHYNPELSFAIDYDR